MWRVERKAYANEYFVGLIEEYHTGELYQIRVQNIRFLTEQESEDYLKSQVINTTLENDSEQNIWE